MLDLLILKTMFTKIILKKLKTELLETLEITLIKKIK